MGRNAGILFTGFQLSQCTSLGRTKRVIIFPELIGQFQGNYRNICKTHKKIHIPETVVHYPSIHPSISPAIQTFELMLGSHKQTTKTRVWFIT